MASQPSALTGALNTAPTPTESDPLRLVQELGKRNDMSGRGQYAQQQSAALLRGKSEAEGDVARREFNIQQGQLRKGAEAESGLAAEARKQYETYEAGLKAPGEFAIPEYTASDYAKGAAQRLVSAFVIGGLTKQSARSQLEMIKQMQDAEDRGLDQEFVAARMKFDEAEKAKDKHNKRLKERFDMLMDLASKDRTAALAQAKLIEADVGEGLIAAKLRAGLWGEANKDFQKAKENLDKLRLVQAKEAGKTGAGLKPGVTAIDRFSSRVKLKNISDRMQDMLKDEKFAAKLEQYRGQLFLQEQNPLLDQFLQSNIPEDVRAFAILAKNYRNQKYREESGLAVTLYEQLRQYGAVPQPGDSVNTLRDKLKTAEKTLLDDISTDMTVYPALQGVGASLGYGRQAPGATAQPAGAGGSKPIASKADVDATLAANKGMTREQVVQALQDQGYQVEDAGEE